MPGPTLIRPPPLDPAKSPMENVLELLTLKDIGPVSHRKHFVESSVDNASPGHLYKCAVSFGAQIIQGNMS